MVFKKIIFQNRYVALETPSRPPPLHGKCHLKFPFWLFEPVPKLLWSCSSSSIWYYRDKGYIDVSKKKVSKEDIIRCTEKYLFLLCLDRKSSSSHTQIQQSRGCQQHHKTRGWDSWHQDQRRAWGPLQVGGISYCLFCMLNNWRKTAWYFETRSNKQGTAYDYFKQSVAEPT